MNIQHIPTFSDTDTLNLDAARSNRVAI
ncbi:MAG: hypothetical protein JWQ69_3497, partial [Pseudomonas sp.]|nr:hypothetical protein [Pseudomonas sp.]